MGADWIYLTDRVVTHPYDPTDPATPTLLVGRAVVVIRSHHGDHRNVLITEANLAQVLTLVNRVPCLICGGGGNFHKRLTDVTLPERPVNAALIHALNTPESGVQHDLMNEAAKSFPLLPRVEPLSQDPDARFYFAHGKSSDYGQPISLRVMREVNKRFGSGLSDPDPADHEVDVSGVIGSTDPQGQRVCFHAELPAHKVRGLIQALSQSAGDRAEPYVVDGFDCHAVPEAVLCSNLYLMLKQHHHGHLMGTHTQPVGYAVLPRGAFATLAALLTQAMEHAPFNAEGKNYLHWDDPSSAFSDVLGTHHLPGAEDNLWITPPA